MEGYAARDEGARSALIELSLKGPLRVERVGGGEILTGLRKPRAILVILALTDDHVLTRRSLAALLWSRNGPAQALARLRDTLSTLRQGLREATGDGDILRVTGDRVALRPDSVRVDLGGPDGAHALGDFGADLFGIDPALDAWLHAVRARLEVRTATPEQPLSATPAPHRQGVLIGIGTLQAIGSGDAALIALGLADEMATALSRVRGASVVALGQPGATPGRDGLDFVLDGSLQQLGARWRIAVKLVEASTGMVCWTSIFDYDHDDLFHIQQDVAALVAAGLEPELPAIAAAHMTRVGVPADDAYLLMLRAVSLIHRLDRRSFEEAGALLNRVIALQPDFSAAYSWLALWHVFLVGQAWARDPRASIARAGEVAEHAVMLDPTDARGLTVAGHVRAFLHRRLDEAMPLHERALAINPSLALAWNLSGVAFAYRGDLEEARRRINYCRRLSPRDPHIFFADGTSCLVEMLSRHHELAIDIGRKVTQLQPRFSAAFKPYLAALGHVGQVGEAALVHRRLLQLEPDFNLRSFRASAPFARREHMAHYTAGLREAGVQ